MDEMHLTSQEARALVDSILEGVDFVDDGAPLRASWAREMRDWCVLLLTRIYTEREGDA